ncbi:tudor domain-containing protein 15-like [Brachyistius frenatus]|uniref:tudor domain-containing protein 15-like n=1 Tax=Brachyistius frenatus TaxID=100188 RepID=UPI0037E92B78
MQSVLGSKHQMLQDSVPSAPCALWPVDLKLTHLDWNPEAALIHFQGQYPNTRELDYNILHGEIQSTPKTKAAAGIGEFCLVEDFTSARWYRGRVQNRKEDLFDIFLIDHGNILSVDIARISPCSKDLLNLPPKIVCGFLANLLLLQNCPHSVVDKYFSSLTGRNVTGYIHALLPHNVLLLEVPDINSDLVRNGFGKHVDTDTFLLLVGMLTEVPLRQNLNSVPDLPHGKLRGHEFCSKPSSLQGYEDMLSFSGLKLSCGTRAKVRVTAAVNPGLFYCQMAGMETDLWEMSKKFAAIFEHKTKQQSQKTPENMGLLCSVKGKSGQWYRGFLKFLPVNSQVRVLFIDYGFFESVKLEDVHSLPPDFYSIPIMAFRCTLSALIDQDTELKTQQLSLLKAGLLGGVLDVEIRGFDEKHHLYSVCIVGVEDNHLKEPEPIQRFPSLKVESVLQAKELSPQVNSLNYETVLGEVLHKTLEEEDMQIDSVFVGYVVHAQNPNHLWIRTQKRNDEFEEMMSKMADHFSQVKLDEDVLLNPEPGTLCCAVYEEDMHFYRGIVTSSLEHGAEVLFIDFGNIAKVPSMLIKNIPDTFARKSAFAICCTLVNVFPLDDSWTSATNDFFRQAVSNKVLQIHVFQLKKNKLVVNLFEMGSDNSQSITELLISSKQAEYISKKSAMHSDVMKKISSKCSVTTDISGNAEQWKDCEEEENMCKNEAEKAQAPASVKVFRIKAGCEFAVRCSYINSPSDFWCQFLDKIPVLEELMGKIQHYYSAHTIPLQAGDSYCIARSPQDGRWYRAFIIEKQRGHSAVMLVDYGFTIKVSDQHLQVIVPEFVYLEGQAFRCSLYNLIEPADPKNCVDWSPEVYNLLIDFVLKSTGSLKCKVVSQLNVKNIGLCNVVDLYNTQTQQSVTNTLIEQGLAREAKMSTKQQSTAVPESFVYSSFALSPGNEEQVYVTHVSSQCEVYCHLERNTETFEELQQKISEESETIMQASARAVVRKMCLAKYCDGQWYRAIAHPVQSPLHLGLFFVDYGNTNISEKSSIMFIPRDSVDLLYTPMQAVRFSLKSVSKEEVYADAKEWLNSAVLDKLVRAVIHGRNDDGSFDVELFDGEVNINEKVKELILSLAPKPKKGSPETKQKSNHGRNTQPSVKSKRQPKGRCLHLHTSNHYRNTEKKENTNPFVHGRAQEENTKVKQQKEDTTKTWSLVKPQETSEVKQQREDQDAKSEQPQRSEETEIPQLSCLPDKNMSAGFRAKCFISHIDSVNSFFLQLSEDELAILKMVEDLNSSVFRDSLKSTTSLRINDIVLSEFEDGALYRAVVKNYEGNSSIKIEFVDYGNSAVVGNDKIYAIPKDYLSQPRFSISCSLFEASVFENDASFTDAAVEKPLVVNFVRQCGTKWEVKVEILDDDVNLNTALEADVERSPVTEMEEDPPTSSSEAEEKRTPCEQKYFREEVCDIEISKSEKAMTAVVGEYVMTKPPAKQSAKLKVRTCRCRRRRAKRNMNDLKRSHRKTKASAVKVMRDGTDAFIPPTIQVNDTEKGTILSVQNNGSFYVRFTCSSEFLTALESHMAENLHKCEMVAREDIKQELKCLVQVQKDKKWRRAVVQQIYEDKCKVLLVDHGLTKEIPSGSVRQQCCKLTKIPNFAMLCKINSLEFSKGEEAQRLWYKTLKPLIGKEVNLFFVRYSEADNLWMVEVVMNRLFPICQIEASLQQKEEKIPSLAEIQNAETHNEGPEKGPTSDTSPPQQFVFASIDTDKAYSGFAAAITTPCEFCVVLEDLLMNKVSLMLDNSPGQLSPLPEAHLIPGTCCLLKSASRNKWCRAKILHIDTTVVLNLVDYGYYECTPLSDRSRLKKTPVEITKLPKRTYPCILRGVKPVGEDGHWSDEAVVFFQQCLYQKNLLIFFREFEADTHWKVDILADGVNVAQELIDAGHANYRGVMPGVRLQKQSLCETPPRNHNSEEDCGQQEEGSDEVEAIEESKGKRPSRSSQCFLM